MSRYHERSPEPSNRPDAATDRPPLRSSQVKNLGVRKMHYHAAGDFIVLTIGWALIIVGIYALS